MISLDFAGIEQELANVDTNTGADGTHTFDAEWVRGVFELAIERVRAECITQGRASAFAMFERYDILGPDVQDRVTYGELAAAFEVSQSQVTNYLALVRRRLRHHLLAILRETTVTEAEFRAEIREILDL